MNTETVCPDCKGKGTIELLTSSVPCTRCALPTADAMSEGFTSMRDVLRQAREVWFDDDYTTAMAEAIRSRSITPPEEDEEEWPDGDTDWPGGDAEIVPRTYSGTFTGVLARGGEMQMRSADAGNESIGYVVVTDDDGHVRVALTVGVTTIRVRLDALEYLVGEAKAMSAAAAAKDWWHPFAYANGISQSS
jgi:hypothetical protein